MHEPTEQARNAAAQGDVDQLKSILQQEGAEVVRADQEPDQPTSLHLAAGAGQPAAVSFLLSSDIGADAGAARLNNFTPLHAAAMNGETEICELLISAGADPNVQTVPQGYAPIHSASWGGHSACVAKLLESGARSDLTNYRDERPAETARRQGHDALAEQIEQFGN